MSWKSAHGGSKAKGWSRAARCVLVVALLVAPAALANGSGEEDLVVPEGMTFVVTGDLSVRDLVVLGTLRMDAPGDWTIEAQSVYVGPRGLIQGRNGQDGASAVGRDATGEPGVSGGNVFLLADDVTFAKGGRILAGWGGHGGSANGFGLVSGGAGGGGGHIVLQAAAVEGDGLLVPGVGGSGGHAIQVVDGTFLVEEGWAAVGGRGGDVGVVFINGQPQGSVDVKDPPLRILPFLSNPLCLTGPFGASGTLGAGPLAGGSGGNACMIHHAPDGVPGADCGPDESGGDAGGGGLFASANALGGDGGMGSIGAAGGPGGNAYARASAGSGGDGGSCMGLSPGQLTHGAPGGGGASAKAAAEGGAGGRGTISILGGGGGAGGPGGCAEAVAKGGRGGDGGDGRVSGGGGGGGGPAKATATGGPGAPGGTRAAGADGGCATANASGGRGGHGGDAVGGTSNVNSFRQGGAGGDAGATVVTAVGGPGGAGNPAGFGGKSKTTTDPVGGDGGLPNGRGGAGGEGAVTSQGGPGGAGCNTFGGPGGNAEHNPLDSNEGGLGQGGSPNGLNGFVTVRVNDGPPGPDSASGLEAHPDCTVRGDEVPWDIVIGLHGWADYAMAGISSSHDAS